MPIKGKFQNNKLTVSGGLNPEVRKVKKVIRREVQVVRKAAKKEVGRIKSAVMKDKNVRRVIKRGKKVGAALK